MVQSNPGPFEPAPASGRGRASAGFGPHPARRRTPIDRAKVLLANDFVFNNHNQGNPVTLIIDPATVVVLSGLQVRRHRSRHLPGGGGVGGGDRRKYPVRRK